MRFVQVKMLPELHDLIGELADKKGLPMGEWLAQAAAKEARRPELGVVPRKKMGRPRKTTAVA